MFFLIIVFLLFFFVVKGCITLLFSLSFWTCVCIFVAVNLVTQLSCAKFNTGESGMFSKSLLNFCQKSGPSCSNNG